MAAKRLRLAISILLLFKLNSILAQADDEQAVDGSGTHSSGVKEADTDAHPDNLEELYSKYLFDELSNETREMFRRRIEVKLIEHKIPEFYEKIKNAITTFKQANKKEKKSRKKNKRIEKSFMGIKPEEVPIIEDYLNQVDRILKLFHDENQIELADLNLLRKIFWNFKELMKDGNDTTREDLFKEPKDAKYTQPLINDFMDEMHMDEILALRESKTFLRKLAHTFMNYTAAGVGRIKLVKFRMRRILGKWLFKMEMHQPVLHRADINEPTEMFNLYEQALSKPYLADSVEYSKFEFIFGFQNIWLENINKKTSANERKEKLKQMEKYWQEHYVKDELEAFKAMSKWWFEMAQVEGEDSKTKILSYEHLIAIKQLIKEPGIEEFKKFLAKTRGAKGRLMKMFGMSNLENILKDHQDVKELLEIANTPSEVLKLLASYYIRYFNAKTDLTQVTTGLAIDMLVQIHFLDEFFDSHKEGQPEAADMWKNLFRINYLLCMDMLLDFNATATKNYGILFRNIFYVLRELEFSDGTEKWNLNVIIDEELNEFNEGHHVYLDEEKQVEEIRIEHAKIFDKLRNENAKFQKQLKELNKEAKQRMENFLISLKLMNSEQIYTYDFGTFGSDFDHLYVELFFEEKTQLEREKLERRISGLLMGKQIAILKNAKKEFLEKTLSEFERIEEELIVTHEIDTKTFEYFKLLYVQLLLHKKDVRTLRADLGVSEISGLAQTINDIIRNIHVGEIKGLIKESDFIFPEEKEEGQKITKLSTLWEEVRKEGGAKLKVIKSRMRHLLGKKMFEELEKNYPILYRLDVIEDAKMLSLYKAILSHPLSNNAEFSKDPFQAGAYEELHLSIAQAFSSLWQYVKKMANPAYAIKDYWSDFALYSVYQVYLDVLSYLHSFRHPGNTGPIEFSRNLLNEENVASILELLKNEEIKKEFAKFIQNNNRARARLIIYWGSVKKTQEYLEEHEELRELIGSLEKDIPKLLTEIYTKLLNTPDLPKEEEDFAQINANILVQMHAIDKFMKMHKDDQPIAYLQWFHELRLLFFLDVDIISGERNSSDYTMLNYNLLYKIRECETGKIGGFWNFIEMTASERAKPDGEFQIYDLIGQTKQFQAGHIKMIEQLKKENNEFKTMIDNLQGKARNKLNELIGKQESKKKTKKREEFVYEECIYLEKDEIEGPDPDQVSVFKFFVKFKDSQFLRKELDLDAILWHFESGIEQFLNEKKLNSPGHLDRLRKEWEIIKNTSFTKLNKIEAKEKKLCKFQEFIEKRLKKHKELMKNHIWKEHLAKSEFINGLIKFEAINSEQCEKHSFRALLLKTLEPKLPKFHFNYMDWLISNFDEMRIFLCKQIKPDWKEHLICLFEEPNVPGELRVATLETMHPEVLKIGHVQKDVGAYFYKQFLENKDSSVEADAAEARLAIAYMIRWINEIHLRKDFKGTMLLKKVLNDAEQKRTKQLKTQFYKKPEELASKRNICLLLRYIQFEPSAYLPMKDMGIEATAKRIKAIENWNETNCEKQKDQNAAFLEARQFLVDEHTKFFVFYPTIVRKLTKNPGQKIRMDLLIPGYSRGIIEFKNIKETEKYEQLFGIMRNSRDEIRLNLKLDYDALLFDDTELRACLLQALTSQDPVKQLANRLRINIISAARWMSGLVKEKIASVKKQQSAFDEITLHLGHEYDKIAFQFHQIEKPKLEVLENELAGLLLGVKIFLSQKRTWKINFVQNFNEKLMMQDEMWKFKWANDEEGKYSIQYKNWIEELNYNEFLKQLELDASNKEELEKRKNFIEKLKKDFKIKYPLSPLIGEKREKLETITKKLELNFTWDEYFSGEETSASNDKKLEESDESASTKHSELDKKSVEGEEDKIMERNEESDNEKEESNENKSQNSTKIEETKNVEESQDNDQHDWATVGKTNQKKNLKKSEPITRPTSTSQSEANFTRTYGPNPAERTLASFMQIANKGKQYGNPQQNWNGKSDEPNKNPTPLTKTQALAKAFHEEVRKREEMKKLQEAQGKPTSERMKPTMFALNAVVLAKPSNSNQTSSIRRLDSLPKLESKTEEEKTTSSSTSPQTKEPEFAIKKPIDKAESSSLKSPKDPLSATSPQESLPHSDSKTTKVEQKATNIKSPLTKETETAMEKPAVVSIGSSLNSPKDHKGKESSSKTQQNFPQNLGLQFGSFGKESDSPVNDQQKESSKGEKEVEENLKKTLHIGEKNQKSGEKETKVKILTRKEKLEEHGEIPHSALKLTEIESNIQQTRRSPNALETPKTISSPVALAASTSSSATVQIGEASDLYSPEIMMLNNILTSNRYGVYTDDFYNKNNAPSNSVIQHVKQVVRNWALQLRHIIPQVHFIVSGSHLLKAQTMDSDIDMLLIFPYDQKFGWKVLFYQNILGTHEHNLIKAWPVGPIGRSLYHELLRAFRVVRIILGRVSIFKFNFYGYSFDLNLVVIPQTALEGNLPLNEEEQPSLEQIDAIIAKFITILGPTNFKVKCEDPQVGMQLGMVYALSGYRSNLQILRHLKVHQKEETFRTILLALKFSTKKQFIYDGQFGFFNGTTLSILVAKLILESNMTIMQYLEEFHHRYSKWDWSTNPIIELPLDKENDSIAKLHLEVDWNIKRQVERRGWHQWNVVAPGFPTQIASNGINKSMEFVIRRQLEKGASNLEKIKRISTKYYHQISVPLLTDNWKQWLFGVPYNENDPPQISYLNKYRDYHHYMAIVCTHTVHSWFGGSFCDFVESKILFQLMYSFDWNTRSRIELSHPFPGRVLDAKPCPHQYAHPNAIMFPQYKICTVWWVGFYTQGTLRTSDLEQYYLTEPMQSFVQSIKDAHQQHRKNENTSGIYPKWMPENMWMEYDLFVRLFPRDFLYHVTNQDEAQIIRDKRMYFV